MRSRLAHQHRHDLISADMTPNRRLSPAVTTRSQPDRLELIEPEIEEHPRDIGRLPSASKCCPKKELSSLPSKGKTPTGARLPQFASFPEPEGLQRAASGRGPGGRRRRRTAELLLTPEVLRGVSATSSHSGPRVVSEGKIPWPLVAQTSIARLAQPCGAGVSSTRRAAANASVPTRRLVGVLLTVETAPVGRRL